MIELPEALSIARQINSTISGKRISSVTTGHTHHKLAWYYGDPAKYSALLTGKIVGKASAFGGLVEIKAGKANILFGEGIAVRFHKLNAPRPPKHQLLIEFEGRSALSASVQMYGGIGSFLDGELENLYYKTAREKISPFSDAFDGGYFDRLISASGVQKLSLKAFLATEQRIPGLGNGVLQDILFNSRMHPKRKVNTLSDKEKDTLFGSLKSTLAAMLEQGGRDTELDLFGCVGGYHTLMSKNTASKPCPICANLIKKEAYMGGSIYYCETCQKI
jgi:formamidopyrimidine-DNA glycosylase